MIRFCSWSHDCSLSSTDLDECLVTMVVAQMCALTQLEVWNAPVMMAMNLRVSLMVQFQTRPILDIPA